MKISSNSYYIQLIQLYEEDNKQVRLFFVWDIQCWNYNPIWWYTRLFDTKEWTWDLSECHPPSSPWPCLNFLGVRQPKNYRNETRSVLTKTNIVKLFLNQFFSNWYLRKAQNEAYKPINCRPQYKIRNFFIEIFPKFQIIVFL